MSAGAPGSSPPLSWLVPAIVTGSLAPFAALAIRAATGRLGANPIATALNQLGLLALIFLVGSLACTPLNVAFGLKWPLRIRKTLGLFAFFTALSHFLLYAVVDQTLALRRILDDIGKRPFIAVGFVALVLLVPVALTSTKRAVRELGFARWKRLHRLVYVAAILALTHFYMRVKKDATEPAFYAAALGALFAVRVFDAVRGRRPKGKGRRGAAAEAA